MAFPPITQLPPAPSRADDPANFSTKADAHVAALSQFVNQVNGFGAYIDTIDMDVDAAIAAVPVVEAARDQAVSSAAAALASQNATALSEIDAEAAAISADQSRVAAQSLVNTINTLEFFLDWGLITNASGAMPTDFGGLTT